MDNKLRFRQKSRKLAKNIKLNTSGLQKLIWPAVKFALKQN